MLSAITLQNIQCIVSKVTLHFPKTGVVRFAGRNGSGKSEIPKVTKALLFGHLGIKSKREPLINRHSSHGIVQYDSYAGKHLYVYIHREPSKTYVEYWEDSSDVKLKRYLADGKEAIHDLCVLFGFHFNETRDVSLNLYSTFDSMLFISSSPVCNNDLISEASTDREAEKALDNEQIYLESKKRELEQTIKSLEDLKSKLVHLNIYNIAEEQKTYDFCSQLISIVQALEVFNVEKIESIPSVDFIDALKNLPQIEQLNNLPNIDFIEALENVPTFEKLHSVPDVSFIAALNTATIEKLLKERFNFSANIEKHVMIIDSIPKIPEFLEEIQDMQTISKKMLAIEALTTPEDIEDSQYLMTTINHLEKTLRDRICDVCGKNLMEEVHGHAAVS